MPPEIQLDLFGPSASAPGLNQPPPLPPAVSSAATASLSSSAPPSPSAFAGFPSGQELVFVRSRQARHYRLTLKRDGTAIVTIPARGSEREARRFAAEQSGWLARARARQEKRPRAAATWIVGTRILWRGEMTVIRVAPASTPERPAVLLGGGEPASQDGDLRQETRVRQGAAASPPPDEAQPRPQNPPATAPDSFRVASLTTNLRPALEAHFLRVAKIELPARAWELAAETRVPVTEVAVRNQRTRWGSCTAGGVISLNWRLVQAPFFVRDYIIYHELMHLREMNHSARFWARVAEVCPWWQDAERWIKQNGSLLGL